MLRNFKLPTRIFLAFALTTLLIVSAGCGEQSASVANVNSTPAPDKNSDFDANKAYEHVKRMVEIGPHPSGSEAIRKAQDYIETNLKSYGLKVIEDNFTATTPRSTVAMKNIIGEVPGAKSEIVIIAGHYDTKLQPGFVGANDGGSSTATVLEIARVLAKTKPEYTLWFTFFDGEEAVVDWNAMGGMDNTYGSRHMVSKLKSDGSLNRIKAMILVDMIGDKKLDIRREGESTGWLVDLIWDTAMKAGYQKYFLGNEQFIADDHIPFREAGIPVVDLIDFNYGADNSYWHTNEDTLDKISGESMKVVGDVVIRAMPEVFKQLNTRVNVPVKTVPR